MYLLGVTGGIAAYKTAELARLFVREEKEVHVIMTPGAAQFISPLTFQTLTGRPALIDQCWVSEGEKVRHVELAEAAAVMVVAPATANTLGKMAGGIADNLLTTVYLAAQCPVVLVPSMNERMYQHPAVQANLERLREQGCHIMEPGTGSWPVASPAREGCPNRMKLPILSGLFSRKKISGVRALVTAGPTREPLDPVRFISNRSTGLMGYAMARALVERGRMLFSSAGPAA